MLVLKLAPVVVFLLINSTGAKYQKSLSKLGYSISGRSLTFSSENEKEICKETGRFIPRNVVATRMQFHKHKLIVALPRYRSGVPITLAIAHPLTKESQLRLRPFPDWKMQRIGDCEALQSVVDIFLDDNGILWILDTGTIQLLEGAQMKCPPKVVAYCMNQQRVVTTLDLRELVVPTSSLQYLVVDNAAGGIDYVYVSDGGGNAILVLNSAGRPGRRLNLPSIVSAGGVCADALYLVKLLDGGSPHLYLSYLDCEGIFSIETSSLRETETHMLIRLVGIKNEPLVWVGSDNDRMLFYRLKNGEELYGWEAGTRFSALDKVSVRRPEGGRVATHVTAGPLRHSWVMETNMADFLTNATGCFGGSTMISPLILPSN